MHNAEQRRWLPGVPGAKLERIIKLSQGNEIDSGQFDGPNSSSNLAANAFGYFFEHPGKLPALPGCRAEGWPALSLAIESPVRLPEEEGRERRPARLDALIVTEMDLIGVESKRYETFFKPPSETIGAYWSGDIWGKKMDGYQAVRCQLRSNPDSFKHLHAFQLIRHALALRTEVHRGNDHHELSPILFYVYAEPSRDEHGVPLRPCEIPRKPLRDEIEHFRQLVQHDEVRFVPRSYAQLLGNWVKNGCSDVRTHAEAVTRRFQV